MVEIAKMHPQEYACGQPTAVSSACVTLCTSKHLHLRHMWARNRTHLNDATVLEIGESEAPEVGIRLNDTAMLMLGLVESGARLSFPSSTPECERERDASISPDWESSAVRTAPWPLPTTIGVDMSTI